MQIMSRSFLWVQFTLITHFVYFSCFDLQQQLIVKSVDLFFAVCIKLFYTVGQKSNPSYGFNTLNAVQFITVARIR